MSKFGEKTLEELEQEAEDAYADLMLALFRLRKAGHTQVEYNTRAGVIAILLADQNDMRKRANELKLKI